MLHPVYCFGKGDEICRFYHFKKDSYIQWPQIKVFDRNLRFSLKNVENIVNQDIYNFEDSDLKVDRDYLVGNVLRGAIGYDVDEAVEDQLVSNEEAVTIIDNFDNLGLYASVEYLPNLIEFGNKNPSQFRNYVYNSDKPTIAQ